MRTRIRFGLAVVAIVTLRAARADAEAGAYLDIPITQSVNRNGSIRYAVWVKVGERSVEAMIDTGSTGLRVLPSVFRGDITGVPTDVAFGAGLHMAGLAVEAPIEIGSLKGMAPVEVVQTVGCVEDRPDCDVAKLTSDSYLIGGDGYPSEGYSAILGIGFPFMGTDIGNPLASLGVKRWIVELPRPYESTEGHLILDPEAKVRDGFSMLARHGTADADGCIEGGPLPEKQCGTLLFDTGAPAMDVSFEGVKTTSGWADGTPGALSFVSDGGTLTLGFAAGENGGLRGITLSPPKHRDQPEPFILAGVDPYFTYSILYDDEAHAVGLKKREPPHLPADPDAARTKAAAEGSPIRRKKAHRDVLSLRTP